MTNFATARPGRNVLLAAACLASAFALGSFDAAVAKPPKPYI